MKERSLEGKGRGSRGIKVKTEEASIAILHKNQQSGKWKFLTLNSNFARSRGLQVGGGGGGGGGGGCKKYNFFFKVAALLLSWQRLTFVGVSISYV